MPPGRAEFFKSAVAGRAERVGLEQFLVFIAEKPQRAQRRIGRGLAEAAKAGVLHHVAEFLQLGQVARGGLAVEDFVQQMVHLHGAGAAGNAFAAGFVHAELHEEPGDVHHVGRCRP